MWPCPPADTRGEFSARWRSPKFVLQVYGILASSRERSLCWTCMPFQRRSWFEMVFDQKSLKILLMDFVWKVDSLLRSLSVILWSVQKHEMDQVLVFFYWCTEWIFKHFCQWVFLRTKLILTYYFNKKKVFTSSIFLKSQRRW